MQPSDTPGDKRTSGNSSSTPLQQVRGLLLALLQWWPYGAHEQCPSLLLSGPTSTGKSHLVRRAVEEANECCAPSAVHSGDRLHSSALGDAAQAAPNELSEQLAHLHTVAVTPPLASSLAVSSAKDGSTGLRRLLRQAVQTACTEALRPHKTTQGAAPTELAVAVVLDHLECYLQYDSAYVSGSAHGTDAGRGATSHAAGSANGESAGDAAAASDGQRASLNTPYPAFLADLHTVLRSAPPLFTAHECAVLHLRRLVFISLFTGDLDEVLPVVRHRYVDYALALPTPTEAERRAFLASYTSSEDSTWLTPALVDALALRTGGVSYGGLQEVLCTALEQSVEDTARSSDASAGLTDGRTTDANQHMAAATAQSVLQAYQSSGSITALEYRRSAGYVDVQVTRWDDIAGMAEVKATLQRLVTNPIRHRTAYRRFRVRPSTGVLLYGPPGTGKTMLAKAMATELNASFVYMDLPELVQSEVGESEKRLQAYFDVARERSPSVVFIDEVQAAFGMRYRSDEAPGNGGVSTSHDARLVSHLLRLLDAAQQDEDHFVLFVGATNVVHLLDPLLLRAGRLDTLLEVPLPDAAARGSLAQRIVRGEWAGWFHVAEEASTSTSVAAADSPPALVRASAQQLDALRSALVDQFVQLSDGFSGAQLRNFTSVFGLQLARIVSRALDEAEVTRETEEDGPLNLRNASASCRRRRRLQDGIRAFLMSNNPDLVLSDEAIRLLRSSRQKSLAQDNAGAA